MRIIIKILGWLSGAFIGVVLIAIKEIVLLPFKLIRGIYRLVKRKREDKMGERESIENITHAQAGAELSPETGEDNLIDIDAAREYREFQAFKAWQRQNSDAIKIERVQDAAAELRRVSNEVHRVSPQRRIPMAKEER